MDVPLVLAGLAMGVAATPHCAAMCGTPCAALTQGCGRSAAGFHVGRLLGYMVGGAVAAGSIAALAAWSQAAPALRPVWTLLHLGLLALGLWWVFTGRHIGWMQRRAAAPVPVSVPVQVTGREGGVRRLGRPAKATLAGLAWVAWPCAALQAALLLAALASSAVGGALVMGAFVVGSAPALAIGPWAWTRWRASGLAVRLGPADASGLGLRVAGVGVALGSGWALTHGLWQRVAAWCGL